MSGLRRFFSEYAIFVLLFGGSIGGHYWFVFVHRPKHLVIHVPVTDREAGQVSVAIQIVASKPKPKLELTELEKEVTPKEQPKPTEMLLAKADIPPEKIITAELPRPDAPPAAPPPPPPMEKIEEEKPPEDQPPQPRKRKKTEVKVPEQAVIETESEVTIMTVERRGVDREPRSRHKLEPGYPASLQQRGVQGSLELKALIDENGKAQNVEVVRSSGYPEFDESALAAVRVATFEPAQAEGKPVARLVTIPISFSLRGR